jgi:FtsH-binding integral membrane protein
MNRPVLTTGLLLAVLLGVLDIAGLAGLFIGSGPPAAVVIAGAALGVLTLAGIRPVWRGGRGGLVTVLGTRLLSAVLSLPVFVTDDAPGWAKTVVVAALVVTAASLTLILAGPRTPRRVSAGVS